MFKLSRKPLPAYVLQLTPMTTPTSIDVQRTSSCVYAHHANFLLSSQDSIELIGLSMTDGQSCPRLEQVAHGFASRKIPCPTTYQCQPEPATYYETAVDPGIPPRSNWNSGGAYGAPI